MKYVVILLDGAADEKNKKINNKTPLMVAKMPNLKKISKKSQIGLVKTIPKGMIPSSDIANLNIMGYDPKIYHTGRSSFEAISMGIKIKKNDIIFRLNFVTLDNEKKFEEKKMLDYSAGEISTEESSILINDLKIFFKSLIKCKFFSGISYRHILLMENNFLNIKLTPPHDISNKIIKNYLPKGKHSDFFINLMKKANIFLKNHKINKKRILKGKNPANAIWLWGEGKKPKLNSFFYKNNLKGGIISAVDLIKGIGKAAKMKIINIEGLTGNINTNFKGKGEEGLKNISTDLDYLYIHIEAPDECSHQGNLKCKIKSLELIDKYIISIIVNGLKSMHKNFRLLILPDHATPFIKKTHTNSFVPYLLYDSRKNLNNNLFINYNEEDAKKGILIKNALNLHNLFLEKNI